MAPPQVAAQAGAACKQLEAALGAARASASLLQEQKAAAEAQLAKLQQEAGAKLAALQEVGRRLPCKRRWRSPSPPLKKHSR